MILLIIFSENRARTSVATCRLYMWYRPAAAAVKCAYYWNGDARMTTATRPVQYMTRWIRRWSAVSGAWVWSVDIKLLAQSDRLDEPTLSRLINLINRRDRIGQDRAGCTTLYRLAQK